MKPFLDFQPPVIAHRGASGYAPENTLAAFAKAAQLGIKWVEFDVMLAATGEPVVFHDERLERTSSGKGLLASHSFAYLQTLDAGQWFHSSFSGERIPTLLQVMSFLQDMKMSANIEIKAPAGQEEALVVKVLELMAKYVSPERSTILYSSFSLDALHLLYKHSPTSLLGMLMHEWSPNWRQMAKSIHCQSVHVNEQILTPERAAEIKSEGKQLLSYTVNSPKRAKELFSYGVDAVFSDVPDKIIQHAVGHL